MNSFNARIGVWACIVLCASLCAYSLSFRFKVESRNKAVGIVAEWDQVRNLAATSGLTTEAAIQKLKLAGLTGIVASEQTIAEFPGMEELGQVSEGWTFSSEHLTRALAGVRRLYPAFQTGAIIENDLIKQVPIGIDPEAGRVAKTANLDLVVRHGNPASSPKGYIRATLEASHNMGARYFLPLGDQVLGRRDRMAELYEALAEFQMFYAAPEFAKIGGDLNVIGAHPERTVRLHAAQAAEMDKLTEAGAIERYAKAATERNIRMLLIRPVTSSSESPISSFGEFIAKVKKQIEREGMTVRSPNPFEAPNVPRWIFVAIGLSLAPIAVFVVWEFTRSRRLTTASAFAFAALGAACWLDAGRGYAGLIGAMALPLAALALMRDSKWPIFLQFLVMSAISIVGGMTVSGLLNDLPYMVKADQFSGVKIAHFLPVVLAGVAVILRNHDLRSLLNQPVMWIQAALGIVILAGLAFMLSRTGNDNPAGVSGIEMRLRELLENILFVRPRTKEFLIGHPAMYVGLGMLALAQTSPKFKDKMAGWTALVILVGMIGQTSLVNTLCHLHTPLAIGFVRIVVGLVLGAILGAALWAIVCRALKSKGMA